MPDKLATFTSDGATFTPDQQDPNDRFGWLDNITDATKKWLNEHPYGKGVLQRLTTGWSDEDKEKLKQQGITPPSSPDSLFHLPFIEKGADYLANKIDNPQGVGGYGRGFIAGALHGTGNVLANPPVAPEVPQPAGPPIQAYDPSAAGRLALHGDVMQPEGQLPIQEGEILPNEPPKQIAPTERNPNVRTPVREALDENLNDYKTQQFERGLQPRSEPDESLEPQAAKTESGGIKIGADVESLGKILGSSLYQGNIEKIAGKELAQNAIDAVRSKGPQGQVNITYNDDTSNGQSKYVEAKDNGPGLTKQELETVFTDLGSSGKRSDTSAVGGFGLAKAAPLLGGERVEVQTVTNENGQILQHSFEGTPDQLLRGINIITKPMPPNTPTGTMIRTFFPESAWMEGAYDHMIKLAQNSPGMQGTMQVSKIPYTYYGEKQVPITQTITPSKQSFDTKTLSHDSADVDIMIPSDAQYGESKGVKYQILNNGMWQGEGQNGYSDLQGIPNKVFVNVRSRVPEGHRDYPFTANRERLRGPAEELVGQYIKDNIVKPAIGKRVQELQALYHGMPEMDIPAAGPKKFFIYDPGAKFSQNELADITRDPKMIELATHISDTLHQAMEVAGTPAWNDRLKKIGFVFAPELKGVHIPNPGANESAILINPFAHVIESGLSRSKVDYALDTNQMDNIVKDPDQTASDILHTILHEMAHVHGGGHDEDFTVRLGEIYGQFGAKNTVDAQNKFLEALSDPNNPTKYNTEIQELLSKYLSSRGRGATKADPLIGTGIGNKYDEGSEDSFSDDDRSTREGNYQSAVGKLTRALEEATQAREEQEQGYTEERGKRISAASKIKVNTEAAFYKQLSKLKGELPKEEIPSLRDQLEQKDIDNLFGAINSHPFDAWQSINAKEGLVKLLNGETPQRSELRLLRAAFGESFGRQIDLMDESGFFKIPTGKFPKMQKLAGELNIFKSLMASMDLSAPLRQGMSLIYRKEWWNALAPMIKSFGSKAYYDNMMETIENDPVYQLGKLVKLSITDTETINNREEAFLSELAEKIPGVAQSEQAYMGFLNKLRFDTFKALFQDFVKANPGRDSESNIQMAREIARFVNTATGRGSLGPLEKYAGLLNAGLFSPRMMASRIQMLNPMYYGKLPPYVRRQALTSILAIAGASILITELAKAAGAKVSYSPLNADFMKARWGNVRLDPNAGFQQYIVYLARFLSAEEESSTTGRITRFGEGYQPIDRKKLTEQFLQNKESPVAGFVDTMLSGQDREGNKRNILNPKDDAIEIGQRLLPMVAGDLYQIAREDPKLLWMTPLIVGGMGSQVYSQKAPAPKFRAPTAIRRPPMLH